MADGGEGKAVKLEQELDGSAEKGADQQHARLSGSEAKAVAMHEGHRQQDQ